MDLQDYEIEVKFKYIAEFECIDISNLTEKEFKELVKAEDGFLIRYKRIEVL